MNTPAKLGAYALGLAVIFGGALGAGTAVGSAGTAPIADDHGAHATPSPSQAMDGHGAHAQPTPSQAATAASIPGGLQVSQDGYTLTPETTTIEPGKATDFRFSVTGPDGRPVTGYQVLHDKKLHFIVVSRNLGDFQHLHPELAGDGVWSVKLTLPAAGAYRAFADFAPEGGSGLTLGADLHAAGDYESKALPVANRTATVDGYTVELDGTLTPGASSKLTLKVSKDGRRSPTCSPTWVPTVTWSRCAPGIWPTCTCIPMGSRATAQRLPVRRSPSMPRCPAGATTGSSWTSSTKETCAPPPSPPAPAGPQRRLRPQARRRRPPRLHPIHTAITTTDAGMTRERSR
ncbi:hypothetical protein AB0M44_48770 [Streptosporangium subroseum]|uniref:hypothetical protein n=1 Tax=Streptosporangium subroseum TaxID=106412 RepID=UPI00343AB76C